MNRSYTSDQQIALYGWNVKVLRALQSAGRVARLQRKHALAIWAETQEIYPNLGDVTYD